MQRRLIQRLAIAILILAMAVVVWRAGVGMGWWNAEGCQNSRSVEKDAKGNIVSITTRTCAK